MWLPKNLFSLPHAHTIIIFLILSKTHNHFCSWTTGLGLILRDLTCPYPVGKSSKVEELYVARLASSLVFVMQLFLTDGSYEWLLFPLMVILLVTLFPEMNHISHDYFSCWWSFWLQLLSFMTSANPTLGLRCSNLIPSLVWPYLRLRRIGLAPPLSQRQFSFEFEHFESPTLLVWSFQMWFQEGQTFICLITASLSCSPNL